MYRCVPRRSSRRRQPQAGPHSDRSSRPSWPADCMNREAEAALRAVATNLAATREDLERIASTLADSTSPLVSEFAPTTVELLDGRTRATYRHHIAFLIEGLGHRRLE